MSSATYLIKETVGFFGDSPVKIIVIEIQLGSGKFKHYASEPLVEVSQSTVIKAFRTKLSPNQRTLIGFFTLDAFSSLSGLSDIQYGPGGGVVEAFSGVDVSNELISLDSFFSDYNAIDGDIIWLQNYNS